MPPGFNIYGDGSLDLLTPRASNGSTENAGGFASYNAPEVQFLLTRRDGQQKLNLDLENELCLVTFLPFSKISSYILLPTLFESIYEHAFWTH